MPIEIAIDIAVDPNFSVNRKTELRAGRFPYIGADAPGYWGVIELSLDHAWAAKAATGVDVLAVAGYALPAPIDDLVPIELGIYAHEIGEKNQANGVNVKIQLPLFAVAGYHNVTITAR